MLFRSVVLRVTPRLKVSVKHRYEVAKWEILVNGEVLIVQRASTLKHQGEAEEAGRPVAAEVHRQLVGEEAPRRQHIAESAH